MSGCLYAIFCVLISASLAGRGSDESSVLLATAATRNPVTISVQELESSLQLGADRNTFTLRIGVRVSVTNDSATPIVIERDQFRMLLNGEQGALVVPGLPDSAQAFDKKTLQPAKAMDGWLWFSNIAFNGQELPLTLRWTPPSISSENLTDPENATPDNDDADRGPDDQVGNVRESIDLDLNKELRRLGKYERSSLGPDNALLVITVPRNLDILMAWMMIADLQQIAESGTGRLVLTSVPESRAVVMEEFIAWLSTMVRGPGNGNAPALTTPLPKTNFTFQHIALADFRESANRPFRAGRRSVLLHRSVDDAVCVSLTPLYRFVPVDQALQDLRNPHEGVRRAAMAGAVDRLTAEQAEVILEQARRGSESLQVEIAAYLNLIPGSAAVDTLRELALSDSARVAGVALRSLAGSRDDSAVTAMADVWRAGSTNPSLQSAAVQAIVEGQDDRWAPLVSEYVSVFLRQATAPESGTNPAESISAALTFLQSRNDKQTQLEIRQHLCQVRSSALQDMFLQHLIQTRDPENESVIRQCITQRLAAGQVSQTLASAAATYRDSAWTEPLLESFRQVSGVERTSPQLFHAALQCASDSQLDQMITQRADFNLTQRGELLQHLSRINHSQWKLLAEELIASPNELSSGVIQLLVQDASEESLIIVRTRLESYVAALEGTPDASIEGQRFFNTLIAPISMLVHPECRRLMNRLSRSSNSFVSRRAKDLVADASRRSPAARLLVAARMQREAGKDPEADEALDACLELDPLLPDVYVSRASALMHRNEFSKSMEDLRVADRLSPEDIETQSMIALVMVRLDVIEPGLEFAEKVVALAPDDWVSLYNGACTFARATESSIPSAEAKQVYADRAISLLKKSAELKFDDSEHLQKDADLFSLHQHKDWKTVVDLVNANKEPAPVAPQKDR